MSKKISTYEALKAITINAAYQHFEDDIKGTLEVGKQADIVVLSEDPLDMDAKDILEIDAPSMQPLVTIWDFHSMMFSTLHRVVLSKLLMTESLCWMY